MASNAEEALRNVEAFMGALAYQGAPEMRGFMVDKFDEIEERTGTKVASVSFDENNNDFSESYIGWKRANEYVDAYNHVPEWHFKLQGIYGLANCFFNKIGMENEDLKKGITRFSLSNDNSKLHVKALHSALGTYTITAVEEPIQGDLDESAPGEKYISVSDSFKSKEFETMPAFGEYTKNKALTPSVVAASIFTLMDDVKNTYNYNKFEAYDFHIRSEGDAFVLYGPAAGEGKQEAG